MVAHILIERMMAWSMFENADYIYVTARFICYLIVSTECLWPFMTATIDEFLLYVHFWSDKVSLSLC